MEGQACREVPTEALQKFAPVYTLTPAQSPLLLRFDHGESAVAAATSKQRQDRSLKRSRSRSESDPSVVESIEPCRRRNTRVDIPDHITLENVDGMITEAAARGDEETRQELKLVKRLRRNREAA